MLEVEQEGNMVLTFERKERILETHILTPQPLNEKASRSREVETVARVTLGLWNIVSLQAPIPAVSYR